MHVSSEQIDAAAAQLEGVIRKTPLFRSTALELKLKSKHPIYLKAENLQYTGSFKVRGALNKILSILPEAKKHGIVTASAGNHAQGVAFHARHLKLKAKIVMPINTPLVKLRATKALGAEVVLFGESYQEAYEEARRIQRDENREYVHAFDDLAVIIGQGTLAKEILDECPDIDNLIVPIGGGGLIAGVGTYFLAKRPHAKVIGVQADGSASFPASIEAGHPVTLERVDTIAEGIAVKRLGDLTFEIAKDLVSQTIVVNDEEISEGLLWVLENERLFVEGCGGAAIAALFKNPEIVQGPTAVILTGGNLDVNLLARIIERGLAKSGRLFQFEAVIPDIPGSLEKLIHVLAEQKASIVQIDHERVFRRMGLREVNTQVLVETDGPEHVRRIKEALLQKPWQVRFR